MRATAEWLTWLLSEVWELFGWCEREKIILAWIHPTTQDSTKIFFPWTKIYTHWQSGHISWCLQSYRFSPITTFLAQWESWSTCSYIYYMTFCFKVEIVIRELWCNLICTCTSRHVRCLWPTPRFSVVYSVLLSTSCTGERWWACYGKMNPSKLDPPELIFWWIRTP